MKIRGTKEQIKQKLETLPNGVYELTKVYKKRSVSQNAYLHFIFSFISNKTGVDPSEVKEVMKSKFLKQYNIEFDTVYIKRTSDLTTAEINQFIEKIRVFAGEFLGMEIPSPTDDRLLEYIDNLEINA